MGGWGHGGYGGRMHGGGWGMNAGWGYDPSYMGYDAAPIRR
jgi:hypothetical protein